jgi:hypothetical protein
MGMELAATYIRYINGQGIRNYEISMSRELGAVIYQ